MANVDKPKKFHSNPVPLSTFFRPLGSDEGRRKQERFQRALTLLATASEPGHMNVTFRDLNNFELFQLLRNTLFAGKSNKNCDTFQNAIDDKTRLSVLDPSLFQIFGECTEILKQNFKS